MRQCYDLCPQCKSELRLRSGLVLDMYPAIYPAECTKCDYEGSTFIMEEALDAGWSTPEDLKEKKEAT